MRPPLFPLLPGAVLCLTLGACSGASAPGDVLNEASAQVQAGDYDSALSGFEKVLARPDATAEEKFRAARDSVACAGAAKGGGDTQASEKLHRLLSDYQSRLTVDNLAKIGRDLANAGCFTAATEVITEATKLAGDNEDEKAKLAPLAQSLQESGDEGALAKLKALGYVGD